MNVLVIDIGGSHIKFLVTGQEEPRKFDSGPDTTVEQMVAVVREMTGDWSYDVVAIGYPGPAARGNPTADPPNLAPGW
ncbi:MAG: ROK family protein, partial [Lysobacter sp.]|nr:ROK family protein [Lysobacter sp.]